MESHEHVGDYGGNWVKINVMEAVQATPMRVSLRADHDKSVADRVGERVHAGGARQWQTVKTARRPTKIVLDPVP